jgi:hypothetical protein
MGLYQRNHPCSLPCVIYSSDDGPMYTFSDIPAASSSWNCQPRSWAAPQRAGVKYQRESMVLLEYQAMPSLLGVAQNGWLCTFTIWQQLEILSASSWAVGSSFIGNRYGTEKAGGADRPLRTKFHLPVHPLPPPHLPSEYIEMIDKIIWV